MSNLKKYCIANWKMYVHGSEIVDFINKFKTFKLNSNAQVVLCPNYIDLHILKVLITLSVPELQNTILLKLGKKNFIFFASFSANIFG